MADEHNPKSTPGYIEMSDAEKAQLEKLYGLQGPGADYTQGMDRFGDAWQLGQEAYGQQGGWDAIKAMFPKAGKYLAGAKTAGEAFKKSAMQETYRAGKLGMQQLGRQMGQAGGLGSTLHGVSGMDIISEGTRTVLDIQAQTAGMKEEFLQGRMGNVITGLSNLGQIAGQQRAQSMYAAQGMGQMGLEQARLGGLQQGQQFGQGMDLLGIERGYRREPMEFQMQQWLPYQQPGQKIGPFMAQLGGAALNYAMPGMGMLGGTGGQGGGGGGGYDFNFGGVGDTPLYG